jgi:hypothetical protein
LLAPVSRVRGARAFLEQVRPAIEGVQGAAPAERLAGIDPRSDPIHLNQPPQVPRSPWYVPEILFGLLLVNAVLVWLDQRYPRAIPSDLVLTTFFAEAVLAVVSLAFRGGRDPRLALYAIVALALAGTGWDGVSLMRGYLAFVNQAVEAGRQGRPTPQVFSWIASGHAALIAAGWRVAAGLAGLATAFFDRRRGVSR